MALPSSGTLKISDIKAEFGGATPPANFRAFLNGGGYVVTVGTKRDYAPNVPFSGNMEVRDFLGAAKNRLVLTLSTTAVDGSAQSGNATTGSVSVSVSGGSGDYSYSWSVDAGFTTHASGASCYFTHPVSEQIQSADGTAYCTVTDNVTHVSSDSDAVAVTVIWEEPPAFAIGVSPTSASGTSASTGNIYTGSVTVTATGGSGIYGYSWAFYSGTSVTAESGSSATTRFYRNFSGAGSVSGVMRCTVTCQGSNPLTVDVPVSISCTAVTPITATVSPNNVTGNGDGVATRTVTTNAATVTASGGNGNYTYSWARYPAPGDTSFSAVSATSASSAFRRSVPVDSEYTQVFRCTISDSAGNTPYTVDVTATVGNFG